MGGLVTKASGLGVGNLELDTELLEINLAQRREQLARHEREYADLPVDDPHLRHDMYTAIVNEGRVIFETERELETLRSRLYKSSSQV